MKASKEPYLKSTLIYLVSSGHGSCLKLTLSVGGGGVFVGFSPAGP